MFRVKPIVDRIMNKIEITAITYKQAYKRFAGQLLKFLFWLHNEQLNFRDSFADDFYRNKVPELSQKI